MVLKPIGFVRNGITVKSAPQLWESVVSEIVIQPELSEALDNLNEFSHIIVLFWTSGNKNEKIPFKIHPRRNPQLPLVGLFATRSPIRPNPVAKTTVRLLELRGNVLKVRGLDAFDATMIIDIKPYIPGNDSVENARIPEWVKKK